MTNSEAKWYPDRASSRHGEVTSMVTGRAPNRRASISTESRMPR